MFSKKFISATKEYSTLTDMVPAPYLRRVFTPGEVKEASVTVCGLGFYELYLNGERITKGRLAPYISNPDDILYYDRYDLTGRLLPGENVLGLHLGNGMLNCPGGKIWDFEKATYRSAPKAALSFEAVRPDGSSFSFEADENFVCAPSPVYYDDLRAGEYYDARNELPGWSCPGFDDSGWTPALTAETPRGIARICEAEPIVVTKELRPVEVRRARIGKQPRIRSEVDIPVPMPGVEGETEGWLYDFGVNAAGVCRLKVNGKPGQKIVLQFDEALDENGDLDLRCMSFLPTARNHRDIYICRGGEEEWIPTFTYHGFRYCLVLGLEEEQAVPELLTYLVMNSDIRSAGGFSCSDDVLVRLQEATRVADLANFYYFPTDCPHREKNGWTADAALSCEQLLLNFTPERSYAEWLRNIRRAQREDGALPGIIPTGGWGFDWGNGPAWDCILVYLPYFVWKYRGDSDIIRDNAPMIIRYLHYISTRRDENGLVAIGLGDWCTVDRDSGDYLSPLKFTDTVMCMDICHKAAVCFGAAGMAPQKAFAEALYGEFRAAARRWLIDPCTMTALGNCQTSQAMAIFYDVFDPAEKPEAFRVLLSLIDEDHGLMNVGVLGGRVLFRVLSDYGRTDLAYAMVTDERFPSYAYMLAQGNTALVENFDPDGMSPSSLNHHFWGDISGWMIRYLAGICVNPCDTSPADIRIHPRFIAPLDHVSGWHDLPAGRLEVSWKREGEDIILTVTVPEGCKGDLILERGWQFEDGTAAKPAVSGSFRILPRYKKNRSQYTARFL